MVRLNMLPWQHGLGDPGEGERKEKSERPFDEAIRYSVYSVKRGFRASC
jgi:hypothetical protein